MGKLEIEESILNLIKGVYEIPMTKTMLNSKKLNAFLLRSVTRQGCLLLLLLFDLLLKVVASAIKTAIRASLVAQWLRICLLMQGTRVRALVWEDPTCHGAAEPVSHNC